MLQVEGQVQRRLAAELNDDALGALAIHHGENIFQSQRLEIETVGGVVIGGDGLGIAIDHDGFVAVFTERERGMAAAVIELDSLPDAIGAAAEDGDFGPVAGVGLVFFLVGGIKIGSEGLKFGGAGIDALENGLNAQFTPALAHRCRLYVPQLGNLFVARARALGFEHQFRRNFVQRAGFYARVDLQHLLEMLNEPGIDLGERANLLAGHASLQRLEQPVNAVRPGNVQALAQQRRGHFGRRTPRGARFERANALAERFRNVRPMAITSPTDFICVPRVVSAPGNFSNCHLGIFTTT